MPLEEVIRDLEKLDAVRDETARYRDEARAALAAYQATDAATREKHWSKVNMGDQALIKARRRMDVVMLVFHSIPTSEIDPTEAPPFAERLRKGHPHAQLATGPADLRNGG